MNILTLSGWGQPADALKEVAPNAKHMAYGQYQSVDGFFTSLTGADVLIGWSLGGQLAVRAVAEKVCSPKLLVLLAAPYQFVASPEFFGAMPPELFREFCDNYYADPYGTMHRFCGIIAKGDTQEREITQALRADLIGHDAAQWKHWLEELGRFSCRTIDFSHFPMTVLVQGDQDAVVRPLHAEAFEKSMSNAELFLLKGCGHAPHIHDSEMVKNIINQSIKEIS
jgi:pimeloyl-ACP methyl ester carboxylesterase